MERAVQAFLDLLAHRPIVFVHLMAAFGALVLGAAQLLRRKGTRHHRALGWLWVGLMATAAISSAFILDGKLPNIAGFTPIHLFTAMVAVYLPVAVLAARRRNIGLHRRAMRGLYLGGCLLAGFFTLLPGRFLGHLVWHDWLHLVA